MSLAVEDLRPVSLWQEGPAFEESEVETGNVSPQVEAVLDGASLISEQLRLLRTRLAALRRERPMRCMGLVSAARGEGKSTVSVGLARTLALESDRRVLLVEADLRRPSIESYLGLEPAPGLLQYLDGEDDMVRVRRVSPGNFYLLSAGGESAGRPELLGSRRMSALMEVSRRVFDFVVVDCPPLLPVADSVILQDLLDGFLFVVRSRHSPREAVLRAMSLLKPERLQGVIFNAHQEILPSYHDFAAGKYGYGS